MKGPFDVEIVAGEKKERALQPRPAGGKAWARLVEFAELRGIPIVISDDPLPAAKPKAAKAAKTGRTRATSGVDKDSFAAQVASAYADTAMALGHATAPAADRTRAAPAAGDGAAVRALSSWRSLGPTMMPNGQTYGSGRTIVSGRVATIAIDPQNGNHVLCGSAAGGVWESTNAGVSWAPRTDSAPTLTVGAIAFAPSAPATVYCGLGEGNFYASLGAGVLRSTNGGSTWTRVCGAPFMGQGFFDLAVDPQNANHVLGATTSGLWESADGGVNWAQRRAARTWSIAHTPGGGATSEILAACSDGLFRSINGGTAWAAVAIAGAPASWTRLAVARVRNDPRIAYLFGSSGGGRLYRRNAAGAWAAVGVPADLAVGQDWYDWFVGAAPDRDSQVYLGAIDVHRGDLAGTTWTWTKISAKAVGDSIHPDQHAFALHPTDPATIYVGNDGGLYRSPNRGVNWTPLNNGLVITEIEYLAQDFGSSRFLLGGTQDNGSIRYTGSAVWEHAQDGDGGDCGVNRATPTTCFHSFYGMGMERSTTGGGWGTWGWIGPAVPAGYGALFYPPLECNNTTVAQAGQSVFVSRNSGTNWTEVALVAGVTATAMHAATTDRIYVGTGGGRIFRLDWNGAAWARTELTAPRAGASISDIHVEASNASRVWATCRNLGGGRAFVSSDGGTTWTDRSAGLPVLPLNAVCTDPGNGNRVWIAADLGVYQSTDNGATWAAFSNGLPNVLIGDLLFHPHARVLRAGTRNRGVWEIPVDGWLTQPVCGVQFQGALAANQTGRWFTFNWPATWHVLWTVMPTTVKNGAPELTWSTQVERASAEYITYWISVTNLTNVPINFEGRFAILSYY